jgi:acylphosphatase
VHGRVQGVFFRDTVRRRARELGVAGWVRNRPDGAVEAVFEGDAGAVEELVALCRQGPPLAEVRELECFDEPVEGAGGFAVR